VPRVRLGVALLVPAPWCHEIDGLRRATGEAHLDRVAPHITLVPPVNVRTEEVPSALALLRDAASVALPLHLRLGPPATFAPVTPTLHLGVEDDPGEPGGMTALRRLRDGVFVPPLRRSLTFEFTPHVTVRDELGSDLVEKGIEVLADYLVDVCVDRVHMLEEQRHGDARRRWVPVADVPFGPRRVVGRGGVELELTVSTLLDPEATAFEAVEGPDTPHEVSSDRGRGGGAPLVVVARRRGRVVGVVRGVTGGDGGDVRSLLVGRRDRGLGVARHLLAAFHHAVEEVTT
jgi:2'-5' RNA ligase